MSKVSRRLRGLIVVVRRQRIVSVMVKMHKSASPINGILERQKAFQSVHFARREVLHINIMRILFWIA